MSSKHLLSRGRSPLGEVQVRWLIFTSLDHAKESKLIAGQQRWSVLWATRNVFWSSIYQLRLWNWHGWTTSDFSGFWYVICDTDGCGIFNVKTTPKQELRQCDRWPFNFVARSCGEIFQFSWTLRAESVQLGLRVVSGHRSIKPAFVHPPFPQAHSREYFEPAVRTTKTPMWAFQFLFLRGLQCYLKTVF